MTKKDFENALETSDDQGSPLHLRRPTDSYLVNNCFDLGLFAWDENIDIQLVFNYCKAVTYICSYLSKDEDDCPQAIEQVFKGVIESGTGYYALM